jgi:hypothetical protein
MPQRMVVSSVPLFVLRTTGGVIWKNARHWRQVTDIAIQDPEEGDDGRLICGNRIEIAHANFLTPHPTHAGTDVDARTLAGGPRHAARHCRRPSAFLEQAEQPVRNKARP